MVGVNEWVVRWLSAERFEPYLRYVDRDGQAALDLYLWNAEITGAFLCDIGHVEVALRNAYDQALTRYQPGKNHWLLNELGEIRAPHRFRGRDINARSRTQIHDAVKRAGIDAPVGKIIAELPFGFWAHMSDAHREHKLWTPCLKHVYPRGTTRHSVHRIVTGLNALRNRAAHHETLLRQNLRRHHRGLITLADLLFPELGKLMREASRVPEILSRKPIRATGST